MLDRNTIAVEFQIIQKQTVARHIVVKRMDRTCLLDRFYGVVEPKAKDFLPERARGIEQRMHHLFLPGFDADHAGRDACNDGVVGNGFKNHRIGADDRPSADPDISQDSSSRSDEDTVFNHRHAPDSRAPANRHARTDHDLSADPRTLMDHDSDPSVAKFRAFANLTLSWHDAPIDHEDQFFKEPRNNRDIPVV